VEYNLNRRGIILLNRVDDWIEPDHVKGDEK